MTTKKPIKQQSKEDEFFYETEADLPPDLSDLMFDGRRIEAHGRTWLDDDGR